MSDEELDKLNELLDAELPLAEIAVEFGMSYNTFATWTLKNGVSIGRRAERLLDKLRRQEARAARKRDVSHREPEPVAA